ncbi:hypothetical protein E2C01_045802 [Portunus trituberculatus]|uniref:Uncharacterized protein n=1 Tax=Portunus trituberculatus TaxID=210409 RepID=A0A5B7G5Z8_PORTR|nr:hypothetical protein [Portunus trituberculatus]
MFVHLTPQRTRGQSTLRYNSSHCTFLLYFFARRSSRQTRYRGRHVGKRQERESTHHSPPIRPIARPGPH